ncbi:ABC transporter A family member 7-like isoform X3 [Argentina anserina]|nr:ABC transporter A family member 7-like isoform X3 [Potentilla anserina]
METSNHGRASFWTRANALLRKSLTFQKRNMKQNVRLVSVPIFLCIMLLLIQILVNHELDKPENRCGCVCIDTNGDGECEKVCGLEYSTLDQAATCPIPHPPEWLPLLQMPNPDFRVVISDVVPYKDLPSESCKRTGSCPVTILFTGNNHSLSEVVARNIFTSPFTLNSSDNLDSLTSSVLGSESMPEYSNFLDPAFYSGLPMYNVQSKCSDNPVFSVPINISSILIEQEVRCAQGLHVWRNSSSEVNNELYKGYRYGNSERKINELLSAYDFSNSNENNFNVSIWYNSTFKNDTGNGPISLLRLPRSVNLVSNAYLQFLLGYGTNILLEFIKEMPKPETSLRLDFSSLIGTLFYTWVILQLFPVVLTSLVYEKEQKLRIMMKMHGLGDGPYWMISYMYFLVVSSVYMLCFVIFGSLIGLKFFTLNDYSIQFVFYFIYINLQVSTAFLVSTMFSNVKTSAVIGYICVFGTGLLGASLFEFFLHTPSVPRGWITVLELYPGFSLYRGLYEFAQYSFIGNYMGTDGMRWRDLSDKQNGMKEVWIIMAVEWFVVLFIAYYLDQAVSSSGSVKYHLRFFQNGKKKLSSWRMRSFQRQDSKVLFQMDKPDVGQEMERVNKLLLEPDTSHAIICNNLRKVYPGRDGNPEKFAVRGLSLALSRGECFGMLGPNGAGKTSFINMMIGLTPSTSGTAFVQGLEINTQMDKIYTSMGVCPQHDLLWETLTGREHLLFYGRLKNLKGSGLRQ